MIITLITIYLKKIEDFTLWKQENISHKRGTVIFLRITGISWIKKRKL